MNSENTREIKEQNPSKGYFLRVAKWLLACVVVWGLWHTIENARRQLAVQQQAIRQQLAVLDQKISESGSADEIGLLQRDRRMLAQQVPSLWAVRWSWISIAAVAYAASLVPPAVFFHRVLIHMKQRPELGDSIRAHVLGHVGKYVPGKAIVVVLRATSIAGPKVSVSVATVAVFVETLLMMAVGGTVAGMLIVALGMPTWVTLLAIALATCATVPTIPSIFRLVIGRIAKTKLAADKGLDDASIDWQLILHGWAWMLLMWTGIGFAFTLIIRSCPGLPNEELQIGDFFFATAAIALAMVAGFVSLLPGGAGVREIVISTILAPRFGVVPALVAAILARLVFLFVEVSLGVVLWIRQRSMNRYVDSESD